MALETEASGGTAPLDFTTFYNVIDGELVSTSETRHSVDPTTLQPNPESALSTPADVDKAIAAAKKALQSWSKVPSAERRGAVLRFSKAIQALKEDFAIMLSKEGGKPLIPSAQLRFAREEVDIAAGMLASLQFHELPDVVIEDSETRRVVTKYTPIGVTVGFVPWNSPLTLACLKLGPPLVTGNTVVLKPSPFTPYCGIKLVELAQRFFPPGVVQVLSGDDNLGLWFTSHPGVDAVSFTGSTATGKRVMESCSKTMARVTLELGGNDPAIICADVDIKSVVPQIVHRAFFHSGQICVAIKRLYVHASIYDEFLTELVKETRDVAMSNGDHPLTFIGPIQNSLQFERVKDLLADIAKNGYTVALGDPQTAAQKGSYYVRPVIVDNPPEKSRIVAEEQFGPVLPVLKWTDEEDVLRRANDTRQALGASVWTEEMDRAERMMGKLEAGMVWSNAHFELHPFASVGGHKESGLAVENESSVALRPPGKFDPSLFRSSSIRNTDLIPVPNEANPVLVRKMLSLHCHVAICNFASAAHLFESNPDDINRHLGEPVRSEQVHDGGASRNSFAESL
ncbi:hypothetical protein CDV36_009422 [Fusarium kuroshium]|uniref:aldehyde dehydrogenase (NAD(+)) n=1 Tax=Fusarium kuroshium TaxID=2010991 RepID=A0A3M2S059_9HYPO|nr:hypothetical protein CDV36_009422 [Fusarium kuroshium]